MRLLKEISFSPEYKSRTMSMGCASFDRKLVVFHYIKKKNRLKVVRLLTEISFSPQYKSRTMSTGCACLDRKQIVWHNINQEQCL